MSGHCPGTFRIVSILGALEKMRKETITFVMSARLPAHLQHHVSHWTDFYEI
jgi:hypothetical protein